MIVSANKDSGETRDADGLVECLFDAQARICPEATAALFQGESLTYRELDERANQLANHLRSHGVGPDVLVGLYLERGLEAVIAILGVLKAGGAYVPLDPDYPRNRLAFILLETRPRLLLTRADLRERLAACAPEVPAERMICLDTEWPRIAEASAAAPCELAQDCHLAYVIHTSGSTGQPKGVLVERGGLRNVVLAQRSVFGLRPGERALQFSSLAFDASVFDLCMAFGAGATLVIAPPEARTPGPALAEFMRERQINIATLPPSVLAALPSADLPSLRIITVAGEACTADLVERFAPGRRFFNLYGPTEASIWSTYAECMADGRKPPIGKAIPNTWVSLLDDDLDLIADGEVGELCIGGTGVARGYLDRPGLNAERFVADPAHPGRRMYRSGDLGRRLADGAIEFLGRRDDQVKLRGFRIELGEIEAVLRSHPEVRDGVVALKETAGHAQLVAYVVFDRHQIQELDAAWASSLRRHLEARLPAHMLPNLYVPLANLPLTIQGKVDRRALPEPPGDRSQLSCAYAAPRTPLERELAEVWETVLKRAPVGVDDNFFELGGDSLLGAMLLNALQRRFSVRLYIVALFDAPTVAELARYLTTHFPHLAEQEAPPGGAVLEASARQVIEAGDFARFSAAAAAWRPPVRATREERRNPRAVFVLSPPRSGSSLLRIMLAGHPGLFAPPELELLAYPDLAARQAHLSGRLKFMREGLPRALMALRGCDVAEARALLAQYEARGEPTQAFYARLQEWLDGRLLVEKSTTYAFSPGILARGEACFADAVYIHLARHPYGTIQSFEEARLDRVLTFMGSEVYSVRQYAELMWNVCHRNILDFLAGVPRERQLLVRFEDLLHDPAAVMRRICERLAIDYDPAMLQPYQDKARRMTDGLSGQDGGMSDAKFHQYRSIDPGVASRWTQRHGEDFLAAASWELAGELGYRRAEEEGADAASPPMQSYAQQRLWFIDQIAPGNPSYNTSRVMQLVGELNEPALARALDEIVRRHEVCRTNFAIRDGRPVQLIHAARPWPLRHLDLSDLPPERRQGEVQRHVHDEVLAPFDLARDPLCRGLLIRLDTREHVLVLCIHHIVSDAWSRSVLHRELSYLYAAFRRGAASSLPELPMQYADFSRHQRREMEGAEGRRLQAYWLEQLRGAPTRLNLPADLTPPVRRSHKGASRSIELADEAARQLKEIGQTQGATPFMTFLLAYALLLGARAGQDDLLIGIPVSGRNRPEYEGLIGQFINVVPIRVRWSPDEPFSAVLAHVRDTCVGALAHQDYPFDLMVSGLKLERAPDHHPLFQVMFAWEQPPLRDLDLEGLEYAPIGLQTKPMPYDLILSIQEGQDGLRAVIDYNLDLYTSETIDGLAAGYAALIQRIAAAAERPLREGVLSDERALENAMTSKQDQQDDKSVAEEAMRKRERLKQLLLRQSAVPGEQPIQARSLDAPQPLSFAQEELWLLDRIEPGSVAFNIGVPPLRLDGPLDADALERALRGIVGRHAVLRTVFAQQDGQPVQVIRAEADFTLTREDLSTLPPDEREAALVRRVDTEHLKPFDLAKGPLLRATLVRMDAQSHVLLLSVHHIVFDASSVGRLFYELANLYGAQTGTESAPLPPLPVQYADFAAWQRGALQAEARERQLAFWMERLQGLAEPRLPTDHPRPAQPTYRAFSEYLILPADLSDALRALSRRENVTLFHTTLAAYMVLLHRYGGEEDILVGSPVTTRRGKELEGLIGFFVNMVLLRGDLSGRPSFREVLGQVRQVALSALQNSDVPFDSLFRQLRAQRGVGRNNLFQATFAFEGTQARGLEFPGVTASIMPYHAKVTRFDIETYVRDEAEGMRVVVTGATDLYEPASIRRMLEHFRVLLEAVAADPGRPIDEYPLTTKAEREVLLHAWNDTATAYPRDASVHELFEAQARQRPDAVALEYGDATLSYGELDARADRLAAYLRSLGVGPETPVGLAMERSAAAIVAMLGILKAGGAYVPLDPEYPAERLEFMLRDTGARIIVSQSTVAATLPSGEARVVCIDSDWPRIADSPETPARARVGGDGLAYVIYTSGSTGTPKGVPVRHRGIVRLVRDTDYVQVCADDRFAQVSVTSFDAATFEIWGALLNGARVVGVPREVSLSPGDFARFLRERRITTLFLTTALFNQMARHDPAAFAPLRYVLFGGEACDPAAIREVLGSAPPANLLHVYGPTEVTTYSTWHRVTAVAPDAQTVPIGRPIANTTAYVLDAHMQPVPVGVPGELYLGGDGLARGYLNRPELTQKSFVANPFATPGELLYRTGDWVRYRADGAIEFIGRRDGQVKVRGFRIELGEIEAALCRLPRVREAVVLVREDRPGDKRVVAYVVPADADPTSLGDLRAALRHAMPDYMIPAAFVPMASLPLTPNGKVNRAALPAPSVERPAEEAAVKPRNVLEDAIAGVWCEMLGLAQVGIKDNFFDLGGHSLLLVKTHARLCEVLGCQDRLKVVDLFEHPTIETLARHLGKGAPATQAVPHEVPAAGARAPGGAVAIVGMAGRFPDAPDVETFWANLRAGRESIHFFSAEEMREAGVPDEVIDDPGYVGARGYLADADKFDAGFFGYSAREAELMDPQHRLLLECAQEALESGGYDPERYAGAIGVYAGSSSNSYLAFFQSAQHLPASMGGLSKVLASSPDFLTTRISYKLNLRGPSANVQTACSTSLVAVHHACRALQDGDCDMALAGGVSVTVPMKAGHMYMEEGIGSRDGHCRAFDADASGTVGGNGVAMVLLKRLDDALHDGDQVRAVILGSAINNDGAAKVGFTAPSVEGQAAAIRRALAVAGCAPDSVGYLEAHGTGTLLGDPIEVAALAKVYGGTARATPCALGALKSNVGHLDAAAGVAGLIKAALCLEHGELVPSLNFSRPNPQIDFAAAGLAVNTQSRAWPDDPGQPRRAGVSSFGLGGTNAHAVLEQPPTRAPSAPGPAWQLLCLSARSAAALERGATRLAEYLEAHPDANLADVAYTLQVGRREFAHRRVVVCDGAGDAARVLRGGAAERTIGARLKEGAGHEVVFMFSGQGTQYPNMALGLYRAQPLFREIVDAGCERLRASLGFDLREVLFPSEAKVVEAATRLQRTELTQPALFLIEYAMARMWMSWGIRPVAMIGHSIGEYVAACLSGVMSLEDALDLVAERGRLLGALPGGAMLSVPLAEAEVLPMLGTELSLAGVNGPQLCVVAGPETAVAELEARLASRELGLRRLHTSHAFHSHMVAPVMEALSRRVAGMRLNPPQIPYLSNVSGDWITATQATDPAYYASHLRQAVRFADGLARLLAEPARTFLELGPGHTLCALAKRHPARSAEQGFVASLRHPQEEREDEAVLNEAVGRLWLAGARPDWAALHGVPRRRVRLPTYAFERARYWLDAQPRGEAGARREADPAHWSYVPSWRRVPVNRPNSEKQSGSWLLFDDGLGVAEALAATLAARGARVVRVLPGAAFAALGEGLYQVAPAEAADYRQLLRALRDADRLPDHVAHLWLLDPVGQAPDDAERQGERGLYSLVPLLQALATDVPARPVGLAVVASHAREVTGSEAVSPDKAMVEGLCLGANMELPGLHARFLDVDPVAAPGALARILAADLCAPWHEAAVAYRNVHRWVLDYEPVALPAPATPPALLREGGVYLITGGLGGIGLELADYLAGAVHARLALVGRTVPPVREEWDAWLAAHGEADPVSRRIRRIQAMEAAGGTVLTLTADVADEAQMATAFAQAEARLGPLAGVFHAAGAEKRAVPLAGLGRADCEAQLRPRAQALCVLERVLQGHRPDFCLVNSSLASAMGVLGFAAYTAAHLYMDAFAARARQRAGYPWLLVNWDNWNLGGDAQGPAMTRFHMNPREATQVLGRILDPDAPPQVLVSSGDLRARVAQWAREEAEEDAVAATDEAPAAQGHPRPELSTPYEAPRNEAETTLAAIWQEMLGIDRVGIHDNFFELGGDSVLNIQITARANQAGLRLTPKQVFERQTVAELAAVADTAAGGKAAVAHASAPVTGRVPLTPIQRWFFARKPAHPAYFNLPLLLQTRRPLDVALLGEAITRLERHHDALRMRYTPAEGGWTQEIVAPGGVTPVERIDLAAVDESRLAQAIETEGARLQASLDIHTGPVLRAANFDLGAGRSGRLLLVAHHLVMDMIGWRIFLEDLQTAYLALEAGREPRLPAKTTSIKEWAERLAAYAESAAAEAELPYWRALTTEPAALLPIELEEGDNSVASAARVVEELDAEETRALLTELPRLHQAQIQDALLLALTETLCDWTGGEALWLDVEGHGREAILDGVDVSRTIGWFTSIAPLALRRPAPAGLGERLREVRQRAQAMPHHGMGFGILRYLNGRSGVADGLAALPTPQVSFLYMGQFDQAFAVDSLFAPATESAGPPHDPAGERHHLIEINSIVSQGRLRVSWTYSRHIHGEATLRRLAAAYMEALRGMLRTTSTPADAVPARAALSADISAADLAEIARQMALGMEEQA